MTEHIRRFIDWPDESVKFLPRFWQQKPNRVHMKWETVQKAVLTDWEQARYSDGFTVHPLGLLIGRANRP